MEKIHEVLYTQALADNAAVSVKKTERQLNSAQRALLAAIGLEGAQSVKALGDISVPAFSLDEGLRETVGWYRANGWL